MARRTVSKTVNPGSNPGSPAHRVQMLVQGGEAWWRSRSLASTAGIVQKFSTGRFFPNSRLTQHSSARFGNEWKNAYPSADASRRRRSRTMSEVAAPGPLRPGTARTVLSDDRLARRATKGDRRAFAAIYSRYHQGLYRFCLAIVGNSQDAQDALQNTMVKVLGALPGEKRQIQLKPWLYRIAHNESIEVLRRRRPVEQLDLDQAAGGPGLAEEAALRERLRRLIVDMDELPERQRAALLMRELAGLDFAEIGAALDTSPATARQTLYEARLSLHEMEAGREMSCDTVTRALSDADGRVTRRRDMRAHLRGCASCRRFSEEIDGRRHNLAALAPLPVVAATGLLHGILGGGTAKALGATALAKSATAVAVVAVIGVSADRGGLVDLGLPGGRGSPPASSESAPPSASSGPSSTSVGAAGARPVGPGTGGRGRLGASHPAAAAAAGIAIGRARHSATGQTYVPTSPGQSAEHPHGRGHAKQQPAAAAHGQQTAAAHKGANHGGHAKRHHPAHPAHAAHPAKPPQPAQPAEPPHPAGSGASEGAGSSPESHGSNAGQPPRAERQQSGAGQAAPPPPETESGP